MKREKKHTCFLIVFLITLTLVKTRACTFTAQVIQYKHQIKVSPVNLHIVSNYDSTFCYGLHTVKQEHELNETKQKHILFAQHDRVVILEYQVK